MTPRSRSNEALAFINGGLQDISLTAPKITWGVEVPWDPDHVFYVWFDALLNYYTALSFARDGEDLTDRFWPAFHILGKDILKFHAVFWPAMLMAADLPLPERELHPRLPADARRERSRTKMSKSLGNVLDPFQVMDTFGTDALRYYCFREVSFGQDGGVSTDTFGERYESELANDYGNLASRTLAMIERYRDGVVPDADVDPELASRLRRPRRRGLRAARPRRDHAGARPHLAARAALNRYVEERAPWQLAKDEANAAELDVTLRSLAEGIRAVTVLLHPYMPETAGRCSRRSGTRTAARDRRVRRPPRRRRGRAHCRRCSPSRSDRQPHAPRLHARARTPRSSPPRARPASPASSRSGPTPSSRAARRPPPRRTRRSGSPSATTPTTPPATPTRSRTSCARSPAIRAAPRSARPASTTTATTPRAPTRSARSPRTSTSRASSASRS